MTDSTSAASLAKRVDELEAENAKLRATTGERPLKGGLWRGIVSAVAIVLASILLPLSILGSWARVQLVDEEAFVSVFAPLIEEQEVQALIVEQTMSAVDAKVDFGELTDDVFDGVSELGLPPRAAAALDLLRAPAAEGMRNLVESAVTNIIDSESFSAIWSTSLRGAHRAFTLASTSDGGGIVTLTPDEVSIEMGPLIDSVKVTLTERGIGAAALIPTVERSIAIGDGQALVAMRTTYALAAALGAWMPVVTLLLFALGIALARRRGRAVLGSGIGAAIGCGALGIGLAIGSSIVAASAVGLGLAPDALAVIYGQVTGGIRVAAWTFFALGLVVAAVGWFIGGSVSARRARAKTQELTAGLRRTLPGS